MPHFSANAPHDHSAGERIGVLVTNLGTPDAPTAGAVRRYLAEFLADPRVIEIPRWVWRLVLHGVILRIPATALRPRVRDHLDIRGLATAGETRGRSPMRWKRDGPGAAPDRVAVALGMRYGSPSIPDALLALREAGATRIVMLPLYPQYSGTTGGSTFDVAARTMSGWRRVPALRFVDHYHDDPGYIGALAASIEAAWSEGGPPDRLLFSFHGLPRRYLDAGDPYHCECRKTARLVAETLGLAPEQWLVAFQSRVGREEWLRPYTDETLVEWGREGVARVDVVCPGFPRRLSGDAGGDRDSRPRVLRRRGRRAASLHPGPSTPPRHTSKRSRRSSNAPCPTGSRTPAATKRAASNAPPGRWRSARPASEAAPRTQARLRGEATSAAAAALHALSHPCDRGAVTYLDVLSRVDLHERRHAQGAWPVEPSFRKWFPAWRYEAATGTTRPGGSRQQEAPRMPCRSEAQPRQCFMRRNEMRPATRHLLLAFAVPVAFAGTAAGADDDWLLCGPGFRLPERPALEAAGPGAEPGTIHLSADEAELVEEGVSKLIGNVVVQRNSQQLRSDEVLYDQSEEVIEARGDVRFWDEGVFVSSEKRPGGARRGHRRVHARELVHDREGTRPRQCGRGQCLRRGAGDRERRVLHDVQPRRGPLAHHRARNRARPRRGCRHRQGRGARIHGRTGALPAAAQLSR